jgi:SAM-dependent methyltransferase
VSAGRPPEWQLPPGVPRGAWQYAQAEQIAQQYDAYFADNRLFDFDEQVLARHFDRPGVVVDLGCGTGRSLIPLARRGFTCLGVDLSLPMLRVVGEKARAECLEIHRVCANLVCLDCLRDGLADYCVCLFSTLGMVRGRAHRQRVLAHVYRILKPGGLFVVHVHNLWYSLTYAAGRRWLLGHLAATLVQRDLERGDRFFDYLGIPKMFVHSYSERELRRVLIEAGLRIRELIRLHATRQRPLRAGWFFGWLRANGWIAVCEKPADAAAPTRA